MSQARDEKILDIRQAAALAGRHPETLRRWVWSGRLPARRHGNRLLVARDDVLALADANGPHALSLQAWAKRAQGALRASRASGTPRSAADLVIEDRERRAGR